MTQEGFKRKLAAILSADVEGYSRLMAQDEEATIRTLKVYRSAISDLVLQYGGRVVDAPGDNILAEFNSVVDAVSCAAKIQHELAERNEDAPDNHRMQFRIGVNIGEIVDEGDRIYGDSVNITARVESMARPGGICISGKAYDQVQNKLELEFENLGEHKVKNISTPIQIYRVILETDKLEKIVAEERPYLPIPDKPSIAVLPFNNLSGDSDQEYFSDGISEDIITALSRSSWLFVIARNSSFTYRGTTVDIKQISREIGVRYILGGSVRKAGNRVRVTAQLIDGINGNHVWADKYDGELQDIFELQDQITQQVVGTLVTQIQIYDGENIQQSERPDVVTWDLLARGFKLFSKLTKDSLAEAETLLRRAVASAPTSCEAHHLLAGVLIHQVFMGYRLDSDSIIPEAYEVARRAVSLNEANEYAHWTLGIIQNYRRKQDLAIAELKRAIELNPNYALAYGALGTIQSYIGDPNESIKNNEIALRANPLDPGNFFRYSGMAMAHFRAGRYSEASHWARKSIHRKQGWRIGHAVLAASLVQLKLLKEAKEAMKNYLENFPNETLSDLLNMFPIKGAESVKRFEDGLRIAGLPE